MEGISSSRLFDPDCVLPSVVDADVARSCSLTTSTTDEPDSSPLMPSGTMRLSYTEGNTDLSSGLVDMLPHRVYDSESPSMSFDAPIPNYSEDNLDLSAGSSCSGLSDGDDARIDSLNAILADLANLWPPLSLSTCYDLIPNMHPVAQMICTQQDWSPVTANGVRYHIYTDGSARRHPERRAAWAFHVVVESQTDGGPSFHRVGYTGDLVDESLWSANLDSIDAEACALIYMADWLFSLTHDANVVVHFDAESVGCGAFGEQSSPVPAATPREIRRGCT